MTVFVLRGDDMIYRNVIGYPPAPGRAINTEIEFLHLDGKVRNILEANGWRFRRYEPYESYGVKRRALVKLDNKSRER